MTIRISSENLIWDVLLFRQGRRGKCTRETGWLLCKEKRVRAEGISSPESLKKSQELLTPLTFPGHRNFLRVMGKLNEDTVTGIFIRLTSAVSLWVTSLGSCTQPWEVPNIKFTSCLSHQ